MKTLEKVNIPQSLWTISKSNYLNSLNTTYNQKNEKHLLVDYFFGLVVTLIGLLTKKYFFLLMLFPITYAIKKRRWILNDYFIITLCSEEPLFVIIFKIYDP